jgi:S1-C subfamily serine protease
VLGTRSGYGLRLLTSGPVEDPLWLDYDWELSANSDHWPFLERKIPVVLLHTGMHEDYHRPSDDVEKVNREGMREVSRYFLGLLIKTANADALPKFRPAVKLELSESRQAAMERLLPKRSLRNWPANELRPRLGLSWRGDEAEPGTVFLTRVIDGTPADTAGLAPLDRIQDINGQPFVDVGDFERTLFGLLDSRAEQVSFKVERNGHVRTVTVRLGST